MKITDEMKAAAFKAAKDLEPGCRDAECATPDSGNCQCWNVANAALTAALATQPDRYRKRSERARDMAAHLVEMQPYHSDFPYSGRPHGYIDAMATKIRNMEMPDDPE